MGNGSEGSENNNVEVVKPHGCMNWGPLRTLRRQLQAITGTSRAASARSNKSDIRSIRTANTHDHGSGSNSYERDKRESPLPPLLVTYHSMKRSSLDRAQGSKSSLLSIAGAANDDESSEIRKFSQTVRRLSKISLMSSSPTKSPTPLAHRRRKSFLTPDLAIDDDLLASFRYKSAVTIQSHYRGYKAREAFEKEYGRTFNKPKNPGYKPVTKAERLLQKRKDDAQFVPDGIVTEDDIKSRYSMHDLLGEGNFASVRRCSHNSNDSTYAMKIIDKWKTKPRKQTQMMLNEIAIMSEIHHPNLVVLYEVYETYEHVYLLLEFVDGRDLFDHIIEEGHFSEAHACNVITQSLSAIEYLHGKRIVHRDLKPENIIVLDSGESQMIKICDFGLSQFVPEGELMTIQCGTPTYMAPEIVDEASEGYELAIDIWAIGVIAYIILSGIPPFSQTKNSDLFTNIVNAPLEFPAKQFKDKGQSVSSDCIDFLTKLLRKNPKDRLTAPQAANHTWLKVGNRHSADRGMHVKEGIQEQFMRPAARWRNAVHLVILANRFLSLNKHVPCTTGRKWQSKSVLPKLEGTFTEISV